jgi:2-oxoglutarate ferredoxin oxidoreductase subunit beta
VAEVIEEMDLQDRTIGVPPAGCAVLAYNYFDVDMGEAPHGRGVALATGIKRVLPDRLVFTYQGDGDVAAIGTAETIHAANRGEKITVIFVNNAVWGMAFAARSSVHDPARVLKTKRIIRRAFEIQMEDLGFSVVEVLSPCPTTWKMNPVQAMKWVKEEMTLHFPLGIFKEPEAVKGVD